MDKHSECLARHNGKALLHAQNHDGTRDTSPGAEGPVVANGNSSDIRTYDYGGGGAADILQTTVADVLMGIGVLYPGRRLSADDTDEHAAAEKCRQYRNHHYTAMAMATEEMEGTLDNAVADTDATITPDANPSMALFVRSEMLLRSISTVAAPIIVPKSGMLNPTRTSIKCFFCYISSQI
jgi:hypothetical protein